MFVECLIQNHSKYNIKLYKQKKIKKIKIRTLKMLKRICNSNILFQKLKLFVGKKISSIY